MISLCKSNINNTAVKYAALYYLCKFEPTVEYFESVFKMNFQERKYVTASLELLIEKFGPSTFLNTIKTVIRSEMRFRSSVNILLPLINSHRKILEDSEIMFELYIIAHRLFTKKHINYDLLDIIQKGNLSRKFIREINSIVILHELETNKIKIFGKCYDFYPLRILQTLNIEKIYECVNQILHRIKNSDNKNENLIQIDEQEELMLKKQLILLFKDSPKVDIPKGIIKWLEIPLIAFLDSSPNNQMSALEIIMDSYSEDSSVNIKDILTITTSLVKSKFPNGERFSTFFSKLISLNLKNYMPEWFLNVLDDKEYVYPPIFEFIPDVIYMAEPEVALSLYNKKPINLTQEQIDLCTFHLFRKYQFSLNHLKKEFFIGFMSKTLYIRKSFLEMFLLTVPRDIIQVLEFILTFDYSNLDINTIEYIIINCLMFAVKPSHSNVNQLLASYKNINFNIEKRNSTYKSKLVPFAKSIDSTIYSFVKPNVYANIGDLFYHSAYNMKSIMNVLRAFIQVLSKENVKHLYNVFLKSFVNVPYRIRLPFLYAFDTKNLI